MRIDIETEMDASVWQVLCTIGDVVADGDTIMMLESMKMEIPVLAPAAGRVVAIHVDVGAVVGDGDVVAVIETSEA